MYNKFVQKLEINSNKIQLIRFDKLTMQFQNLCCTYCRSHLFSNEYTVWEIEDGGQMSFLGFIKWFPNSVAYSKYFTTKVYNSWELGGAEPNQMAQQKAYQIVEWELDGALRGKNTLVDVFTKLALELCDGQNQILLWMDAPDDLLVYPIPANFRFSYSYALGAHYADKFFTL